MSLKGRTRFTVAGIHPLLSLVRDHFIHKGLALVPWDEEPDFALIGAQIDTGEHPPLAQLELQKMQVKDTPVFLLSSDNLFEQGTFKTDATIFGYKYKNSSKSLYAVLAEHVFLARDKGKTIVIRPFNVYGPDVSKSDINDYITNARRNECINLHTRGPTSYLFQDDFLNAIDKLLARFLTGTEGEYNIGSSDTIDSVRLGTLIWNIICGDVDPKVYAELCSVVHQPDFSKVTQVAGWKSKINVHTGILHMLASGNTGY
jgi:nucleoside-diphosphate-sugar epimerase